MLFKDEELIVVDSSVTTCGDSSFERACGLEEVNVAFNGAMSDLECGSDFVVVNACGVVLDDSFSQVCGVGSHGLVCAYVNQYARRCTTQNQKFMRYFREQQNNLTLLILIWTQKFSHISIRCQKRFHIDY